MIDALAFVMRRATRYWPVLATLALGVVLATALLTSGPLLINTVVESGMRRTLLDIEPVSANLRLAVRGPADPAQYRDLHDAVQEMVYAHLGAYVERIVPIGSSRWAWPWQDGALVGDRRVRLQFYDRGYGAGTAGMHLHGDLLAGYWPEGDRGRADVVEAVIGEAMAEAYGLQVGDRLPLSLQGEDTAPVFWIEVAGILRPHDPGERYWFGAFSPLASVHGARYQDQFSALVSVEGFFAAAADPLVMAASEIDLAWHVFVNPASIGVKDIPHMRAALVAIQSEIDLSGQGVGRLDPGMWIETELGETLSAFAARAEAIRVPILFLTVTVMLLALYYVTMDAALALRQFQLEFAVLSSRGAAPWQLFRVQLVEAGLIAAVALLSGPGLAWFLVRLQTVWGPLADVYQADWALWLPISSWIAAGAGVVVCLLGLLLPVPAALRRTIVAYQQSLARAERPPWFQRWYLDVVVLLVGLILIWRLRIYGSIVGGAGGSQIGDAGAGLTVVSAGVDWLLLLAPLALLLGSAAILLRIFPLLLNLAARAVSRGRGLTLALALWRAARDPTHVARLVLLLTLAMALGLFATGLGAALDQNETDQSRYAVGGNLRLLDPAFGSEDVLREVSGVRGAAAAWRGEGTVAVQAADSYPAFEVLAVEAGHLAMAAAFRSDFADRPLPEMLDRLAVKPAAAPALLQLPLGIERLGLWLRLAEANVGVASRMHVEAKLESEEGMLLRFRLRPLDVDQAEAKPLIPGASWRYYEGRVPEHAGPLALHSLWLRSTVPSRGAQIEWLQVGELTRKGPAGEVGWSLTDLADLPWQMKGVQSALHTADIDAEDGKDTVLVSSGAWGQIDFTGVNGMRSGVWYGLVLDDVASASPLPAIVSQAFHERVLSESGDRVGTWVMSEPVEFEVVGTVDYFPTMYDQKNEALASSGTAGFLVTDLEALMAYLNRTNPRVSIANEVFVALEPDVPPDIVRAAVPDVEIEEAEAVRRAIKADPLALGLRSVTQFGYVLTTVLSLAGFATHFYMGTRQHSKTYAVLRALGLAPVQLYATLLFEQLVLIVSGLALGTVLGLLLNRLTLPGLPLSLGGQPPVPPFVAQTDWGAVGGLYAVLLAAFLVSLGVATWLLWRSKLHTMLRVDEE